MSRLSLSTRIFLGTAAAALGAVLVYGGLTTLTLRREVAGFSSQRDLQLARSVARVMEEGMGRDLAEDRLPALRDALVLQRMRDSMSRDRGAAGGRLPGRPQPVFDAAIVVAGPAGAILLDTRPPGAIPPDPQHLVTEGIPVRVDGAPRAYVLAGSMIDPALGPGRQLQTRLLAWSVLAAATALAAAGLVGLAFRGSIRRGIRPLQEAAGKLAAGDYAARISSPGFPDLEPLRVQFNRMAESVAESESRRRGFLHDAAHEIRTPISLIAGRLEMLSEGVYQPDASQLQALQADVARLSALVRALEGAAWEASGAQPVPVALGPVLSQLCAEFQPQADRAGVTLEARVPEALPRPLVPQGHLRQILTNLISNAIRYEPRGGTVDLSASTSRDWIVVSVRDHGPGIPPELGDRIFERFVRGDTSRSRDTGGSGLGLAIARDLAAGGGMRLRLADPQPQPGACLELLLPLG